MSNETYKALIETFVNERAKDLGTIDKSEAFENVVNMLVLEPYDLSVDEIDAGVTDGGGDGQIDAMYVLVNGTALAGEEDEEIPEKGPIEIDILRAPRKIRAFGLRGAMFGREALFEGFEGSPFQGSRLGGLGKGVPSAAMGARVVEMRPLSRYASVAVRSRKANRLMLYTRFIRPIFALARTRPIVRTIVPPMLVC